MITQLTPSFKFICDRCGKEEFTDEYGEGVKIYDVAFTDKTNITLRQIKDITQGQVCGKCYTDFTELANLFFDEVNKERRDT